MSNSCNGRKGDLGLTARCQPDPVTVVNAAHDVTIENTGMDCYYVGEIQVHVLQGGPGSGLLLERKGQSGYLLSVTKLGTYGQWGQGSWTWTAKWQQSLAQSEMIRTTVIFDRSATLDPLDPDPALQLHCRCEVDVAIR